MSFEEFQKAARLYVIGALEPDEMEAFEEAREQFGEQAENCIAECYALHEAFALSLRPAKSSAAIKERLMSMVRERKQG
jgi:hypothetical protein